MGCAQAQRAQVGGQSLSAARSATLAQASGKKRPSSPEASMASRQTMRPKSTRRALILYSTAAAARPSRDCADLDVPAMRPDPALRGQFALEGELTLMEGVRGLELFPPLDPVGARQRQLEARR